jgi:hypothetical protein
LPECLDVPPRVVGIATRRQVSNVRDYCRLLRLGSMDENEKDSREQPKEL